MRRQSTALAFLLALIATQPSAAQQTTPVQRDQQAIAVMSQALTVAGGTPALTAIQDFTASGSITYYWAGEDVQGTVTVKGRGIGQFRLDSSLAKGNKSIVLNNGSGTSSELDGTRKALSNPSITGLTYLSFPMLYVAAVLRDSAYSFQYLGLETKYGTEAHHIRLQKRLPRDIDPEGNLSNATRKDIFVSDSGKTVLAVSDVIRSDERPWEEYQHEVVFSDYRQINGILMPFSIAEFSAGQRAFSIEIMEVHVNTGLADSDFALQ